MMPGKAVVDNGINSAPDNGPVSRIGPNRPVWLLRGLVGLGVVALVYYYGWWFTGGRLTSIWLVLGLIFAILYGVAQLLGSWLLYLAARRLVAPILADDEALSVDVFVTACGEPHELIEKTLAAAVAMRGDHRTWLLDDGDDPALARLAERLGAGYLTRSDGKDAKAGNVNAALARTEGDIVVIFDIDHTPKPDFLERSVGHFADPRVGLVI